MHMQDSIFLGSGRLDGTPYVTADPRMRSKNGTEWIGIKPMQTGHVG